MTVSIFTIAKRLCEKSGWTLSNLELQKMAYITHMFYMGQHEQHEPLSGGAFQAWNYGPVDPDLYHLIKRFGFDPIPEGYFDFAADISDAHPGTRYLDDAVENLPRHRLVAITHWEHGAWRKNYIPNVRGIQIPNADILEEYKKRQKFAHEQQ